MRFATVGTSWICVTFIEAAKETGLLELVAVYSRNEDKGKRFAEQHGVAAVFTELQEMAEQNDIDLVYIASPNALHFRQVMLFLEKGKHVICEKPIFSNSREWELAYNCAAENGVFLFEAIRNIHDPNFSQLQSALAEVGQIQNVVLQFCQYSSRYNRFLAGEEPNVFSPKFSGGTLVDLGVYPLYIAVALFGEPISSHYHAHHLRNGIDGAGTLVLEYVDFLCTIVISKISASSLPSEIQGMNGTLQISNTSSLAPLTFIDRKTGLSREVSTVEVPNNMIYEAKHFVQMIETRDEQGYQFYQDLSRLVLKLTEKSRMQANIVFGGLEE